MFNVRIRSSRMLFSRCELCDHERTVERKRHARYAETVEKWEGGEEDGAPAAPLTVADARFTVQDLVDHYLAYSCGTTSLA